MCIAIYCQFADRQTPKSNRTSCTYWLISYSLYPYVYAVQLDDFRIHCRPSTCILHFSSTGILCNTRKLMMMMMVVVLCSRRSWVNITWSNNRSAAGLYQCSSFQSESTFPHSRPLRSGPAVVTRDSINHPRTSCFDNWFAGASAPAFVRCSVDLTDRYCLQDTPTPH